uniref:Uncharacterized protein n=1 Tax=Arundo donax TaxID=35708 RepID=A0A0A9BU05_ARUDO
MQLKDFIVSLLPKEKDTFLVYYWRRSTCFCDDGDVVFGLDIVSAQTVCVPRVWDHRAVEGRQFVSSWPVA